MTVVSWQLKLGVDGLGDISKTAAGFNGVKAATQGVVGSANGATAAIQAAVAAGKAFQDSQGRLRDKSGRFLSAGEKAALGIPVPNAAPEVPAVVPAATDGIQSVKQEVVSFSKEFDALQSQLAASGLGIDANKAKKDADAIAQVRKEMEKLRAASRASAGATDIEKGMNSFLPSALLSGAAPKKLGAFSRILQGVGTTVTKLFGAKAGAKATQSILGFAQGLSELEPYLPMVGAVAKAGVVVYAAVAGAALMGARAVIQAQAFKEDSIGALRTLLRSNALADQAFRTAVKTADYLGRGRQETVGQFVDLLAKGFDIKKVDEIVRAMADLSTVDPKANMDAIVRAIGQIKGTGRLQGDELLQLADAGLETSAVYEQLAKILGKSVPDVQKLISAGKVDADTAIQAILAAINQQAGGGAAGAAAAKKSLESITGLIRRLENLPQNVLFSMDVAPGMERVRAFMKELSSYFDASSESGKLLTAVLGDAFNEFIAGLLGEDISSGTDGLKSALDSIVAMIKRLNQDGKIRDFGTSLRYMASAIMFAVSVLDSFSISIQQYSAAASAMEDLSQSVTEAIVGFMGDIIEWVRSLADIDPAEAIDAISSIGTSIWDAATEFVMGAMNVGAMIVEGLATGILGNSAAVLNAISQVAGGAIAWAEQILGIHSPSKVFAEIGSFTAEGFAVGVASNDNAQGALADMAAPPDAAGGTLRLGGGRGAPLIGGDLVIRVDGRGADDEKLARLIAAEVQRTLESIAIQMGSVTPEAA